MFDKLDFECHRVMTVSRQNLLLTIYTNLFFFFFVRWLYAFHHSSVSLFPFLKASYRPELRRFDILAFLIGLLKIHFCW